MRSKKIMAVISAALLALSSAGCGGKSKSSSSAVNGTTSAGGEALTSASSDPGTITTEPFSEEETTEPVTKHISPVENLSAECGVQLDVNKTILRDDGSNTIKFPLKEFIGEGDVIKSFTFIVSSDMNIGPYKGGCGINVSKDCPAGKDGWYQCPDFTRQTQGTYGEITWEVPDDIKDYILPSGDVMFGYWWGNPGSIKIDSVICTFTRSGEIPVDGTKTVQVGKSVAYSADDNIIRVKAADILPENAVPEAVVYNVSAGGAFGKFTGAFGYSSSAGSYQSPTSAVFTDSSSLSLTWFVPPEAKALIAADGEFTLGYWYSKQAEATLDSITVKYSEGDGTVPVYIPPAEKVSEPDNYTSEYNFRSAAAISSEIKVGWNLGNSLECYGYKSWASEPETAWGNPITTKNMILDIKAAGFNAIRIPVTWGEHLNGTEIDSEWLKRVHEVVDYAYNEGMFVILNVHHDDYLWLTPTDEDYEKCREKLISIWKQISVSFSGYGDRLLFEGMNEPRTVGSPNEWTGGTAAERAVVNKYEKDFVDTVRSTGGNNSERTLIVTSYAASAETVAISDCVIPNGGNIILSLHYYAPWEFADGKSTTFGDAEKKMLSDKFSELKKKYIDNGQPVIIGEFGCVAAADTAVRAQFYEYYVKTAWAAGIKCFVWDNNAFEGESSYGIYDRSTHRWNEAIKNAITAVSK